MRDVPHWSLNELTSEFREGAVSKYQIAQLNIATLLAPIDLLQLSDFVENLNRINVLADD